VERSAKVNHRILPENYKKILKAAAPKQNQQQNREIVKNRQMQDDEYYILNTNPFVVVFGRLYLRKTCFTLIIWYTSLIIYFGLTLHFDNLGGDIYLNTVSICPISISICLYFIYFSICKKVRQINNNIVLSSSGYLLLLNIRFHISFDKYFVSFIYFNFFLHSLLFFLYFF